MPAGRPRKIRSVSQMEQLWEEYKQKCDNNTTVLTEFSSKNSEFISSKVTKPISYTIEGFCVFIGVLRSAFYDTYAKDPKYSDIVTRMREECEYDVRSKFESGTIPSQLSALWMSKFGYSTKVDNADATKNNELLQSLIDLERKHHD